MDDLISRKALLEAYDKVHQGPPGGARKLIAEAPSVNVATDNKNVIPSMWIYAYVDSLPENSVQRVAIINMLIKFIREQENITT